MNAIKAGDRFRDFTLSDQHDSEVTLSDFLGKPVVLFFYPKDNTSICTKEVCAFRDSHQVFSQLGAVVIGISSDTVESHDQFAREYKLGYTLLSDSGGKVRKLYGVNKTFGVAPGRVTYVIDPEGVVRLVFSSQLNAEKHVAEALRILGELTHCGRKL